MKKMMVIVLGIIITLVIMTNRGSYSWFTSKATAGSSSISTGTLSLEISWIKDAAGRVMLFNATNLVPVNIEDLDTPGIDISPISIRNTGTIDFKFYDTSVDMVYVKDNVPWGGDTDEGQTGSGRFAMPR